MLDSYILMNKQPKNIIKLFTFSIFLLFFILILLVSKLTYTPYLEKKSRVMFMNNDFYLELDVSKKELDIISRANKIIIDNREYFYRIALRRNNNSKQKIYLDIKNLVSSYKINNYVLLVKFKEESKRGIYSLIGGES